MRNAAAAALTLAAAVTLSACGSASQAAASSNPSPTPEVTSPATTVAARDAYELWCEDASSKETSHYESLDDAWASIPANRPVRCRAEVRKGDADPQFTTSDKAAIDDVRTEDGTQDENILFGSVVALCAGWAGEADPQILTTEGNKKLDAVLDVCQDAPHASDMFETFMKPIDAAKPTPTPTQAATRTVTYVVETDGVIDNITYTNFIGGQLGQEQAAGETPGPVSKDYVFPESDMDGGAAHGELVSLGVGAQAGAGTGSITCRILVDGREVAKQTSTGEYAVVSCNHGY